MEGEGSQVSYLISLCSLLLLHVRCTVGSDWLAVLKKRSHEKRDSSTQYTADSSTQQIAADSRQQQSRQGSRDSKQRRQQQGRQQQSREGVTAHSRAVTGTTHCCMQDCMTLLITSIIHRVVHRCDRYYHWNLLLINLVVIKYQLRSPYLTSSSVNSTQFSLEELRRA
jgi:hypothetical protein